MSAAIPSPLLRSAPNFDEALPPELTYEYSDWSAFKRYYMRNWATMEAAEAMARLQRAGPEWLQRALTLYFSLWSWAGETLYVTIFFAILSVSGYGAYAVLISFSITLVVYLVNMMKDMGECVRPFSPPVERRFRVVHAQEFGFPSTHTGLGCVMAFEAARFAIDLKGVAFDIALPVGIVFALNVAASRFYLGAHWLGDILGGFIVSVVVCTCAFFMRDLLAVALLSDTPMAWWMWPLPFIAGRLLVVFHASPRFFCPCILDSVRSVGFFVGFIHGAWLNLIINGSTVAPFVGSVRDTGAWFLAFFCYLVGCLLIEVVAGFILRRILPPIMNFLSGECVASFPPALRSPYIAVCVVLGILSFRMPRSAAERRDLMEEKIARSELPPLDESVLKEQLRPTKSRTHTPKHQYGGTDSEVATTTPQQTIGSGIGTEGEESARSDASRPGSLLPEHELTSLGVAWPLQLHTYWTEAQIMRRYWQYYLIGTVAYCAIPQLIIKPLFVQHGI